MGGYGVAEQHTQSQQAMIWFFFVFFCLQRAQNFFSPPRRGQGHGHGEIEREKERQTRRETERKIQRRDFGLGTSLYDVCRTTVLVAVLNGESLFFFFSFFTPCQSINRIAVVLSHET